MHLMAIRLGDIVATVCPCEQFTDTALNIESRLDKRRRQLCDGLRLGRRRRRPAGRDWCVPRRRRHVDVREPAQPVAPTSRRSPTRRYRRFRAQIHNDARGWETDLATLGSEAEPADPAKIKGNFTHEEFTEHGYRLVLARRHGQRLLGLHARVPRVPLARPLPQGALAASARTARTSSPRACRASAPR